MHTDPSSRVPRRRPSRRVVVLGFVVGFLLPVPAVMLALLYPPGERLAPFLTPGSWLLRPLSDSMAGWPGGVNALLASLANGLVVAALVGAVALVVGRRR